MDTISIRQPYAWLITRGYKLIENRSWTLLGVPRTIAVHASARKMSRAERVWLHDLCAEVLDITPPDDSDIVYGCVIGAMHVARCTRDDSTLTEDEYVWSDDNAAYWVIDAAGTLPEPVPCAGRLGIFQSPVEIELE